MNKLITVFIFSVLFNICSAQHMNVYHDPTFGSTTTSQDPSNSVNATSNPFNYMHDRSDQSKNEKSDSIMIERVLTLSSFFDETQIDSFWQEFRTFQSNSAANKTRWIDSAQIKNKYLILFKVVYGDSFELSDERKWLITDTFLNKETAEIRYKVQSKKAHGFIYIIFDIDGNRKIILRKMAFLPFDYSPNSFIENLCKDDLKMIKTSQTSVLLDTVSNYTDKNKIKNIKGLKKKLDNVKMSSDILFTSRVFVEDNDIWVAGIFDTDKENQRILLAYKLVNKKFKPALIDILE